MLFFCKKGKRKEKPCQKWSSPPTPISKHPHTRALRFMHLITEAKEFREGSGLTVSCRSFHTSKEMKLNFRRALRISAQSQNSAEPELSLASRMTRFFHHDDSKRKPAHLAFHCDFHFRLVLFQSVLNKYAPVDRSSCCAVGISSWLAANFENAEWK